MKLVLAMVVLSSACVTQAPPSSASCHDFSVELGVGSPTDSSFFPVRDGGSIKVQENQSIVLALKGADLDNGYAIWSVTDVATGDLVNAGESPMALSTGTVTPKDGAELAWIGAALTRVPQQVQVQMDVWVGDQCAEAGWSVKLVP